MPSVRITRQTSPRRTQASTRPPAADITWRSWSWSARSSPHQVPRQRSGSGPPNLAPPRRLALVPRSALTPCPRPDVSLSRSLSEESVVPPAHIACQLPDGPSTKHFPNTVVAALLT